MLWRWRDAVYGNRCVVCRVGLVTLLRVAVARLCVLCQRGSCATLYMGVHRPVKRLVVGVCRVTVLVRGCNNILGWCQGPLSPLSLRALIPSSPWVHSPYSFLIRTNLFSFIILAHLPSPLPLSILFSPIFLFSSIFLN